MGSAGQAQTGQILCLNPLLYDVLHAVQEPERVVITCTDFIEPFRPHDAKSCTARQGRRPCRRQSACVSPYSIHSYDEPKCSCAMAGVMAACGTVAVVMNQSTGDPEAPPDSQHARYPRRTLP